MPSVEPGKRCGSYASPGTVPHLLYGACFLAPCCSLERTASLTCSLSSSSRSPAGRKRAVVASMERDKECCNTDQH